MCSSSNHIPVGRAARDDDLMTTSAVVKSVECTFSQVVSAPQNVIMTFNPYKTTSEKLEKGGFEQARPDDKFFRKKKSLDSFY